MFVYSLKEVGNSDRLGMCEVCGKEPSRVFLQTEEREYVNRKGVKSLTGHGCVDLYGCETCLLDQRRSS